MTQIQQRAVTEAGKRLPDAAASPSVSIPGTFREAGRSFALVALSWPERLPGESEALELLARFPFKALHLRKPAWNRTDTEALLQKLSPACRSKIRLHDHLELVEAWNLQGFHLNRRNLQTFRQWEAEDERKANATFANFPEAQGSTRKETRSPNPANDTEGQAKHSLPHSASCHNFEEVREYKTHCDYVFLSPLFDSISKKGYTRAFSESALEEARRQGVLDHQVFALGGVDAGNLDQVRQYGFGGAALLGCLWKDFAQDGDLKELGKKLENLFLAL